MQNTQVRRGHENHILYVPFVATPNQCINPDHSELDHEPRHCTDPEHSYEPEAKVINFITTIRHAGVNEMDDG